MALIETVDVTQKYGQQEVLKKVSLKVERGEVLALIGPTGAGKTTLLRLLDVPAPASQGTDLTPSMRGESVATGAVVSDTLLYGRPRWAIQEGPWKLVVPHLGAAPIELFDLRSDPKELINCVGDDNYADTIASLISTYLEPMEDRIDREKLSDYREYVRETGRIN